MKKISFCRRRGEGAASRGSARAPARGRVLLEHREDEVGRAAALEKHDCVEQLHIEVARDHERIPGGTAMPGEALEAGAKKLLRLRRLEHLELCRSYLPFLLLRRMSTSRFKAYPLDWVG